MVVVSLVLVIASVVTGRPQSSWAASAAMAYVPPSGTRVLLQGSDGTDTVDEYFSTVGITVTQSGPTAMGYAADPQTEDFGAMTWLRVGELTADAQARVSDRNTQVLAVLPAGLELRVAAFPETFLAFRPGLLVLPAGVRDGQSWTSAGTAVVGGGGGTAGEPYSAEFRASLDQRDCMAVTSALTIGSGSEATSSSSSTTWCLGRGMTATSDGTRSASAVDRAPVWQRLGRAVANTPATLTTGGTLERRDLAGPAPMSIGTRLPGVAMAGPVLVFPNNVGGDLIARGWDDGLTNARWFAHPGGDFTGLLVIGRVLVVATSTRRLVAYGDQGEFLWQAELPDVSSGALARQGGLLVVATLDGTVTAYDAETGAVAWRAGTPNEIKLAPVVTAAGVTVVDQAGNLRTFAGDGAVVHSFEVMAPESFTVLGGLAIVAARADNLVRGYSLDTGTVAWRTPVFSAREAVYPLADIVLIRQLDSVLALRVGDGAVAWSKAMIPTAITVLDSSRVLISDRTKLNLVDASGTVQASWATQEDDLDASPEPAISVRTGEVLLIRGSVGYRWKRPA